jgi:dUTP pyrophosphatase
MKVKLLNEKAKAPERATANAAGYDIFSCSDYVIYPHTRVLLKTGISVELPEGYYGRVAPKSGLALNHGIDVMAGVIDSDYRGEISVILYNTDKDNLYVVKSGDKIAQLIIEKYYPFGLQVVDELSESERGSDGFGSTGK